MATNVKNGKRAIRRGGRKQQRRKQGKRRGGEGKGGGNGATQEAREAFVEGHGSTKKSDMRQRADVDGKQETEVKQPEGSSEREANVEHAKPTGACGTTSEQESFTGGSCQGRTSMMARRAAQEDRSRTFNSETNVPVSLATESSFDSGFYSLDFAKSPEAAQEAQMPKEGQMLKETQTLLESQMLQESLEQVSESGADAWVNDEPMGMLDDDDDESQREHDLIIDMDAFENAEPGTGDCGVSEDAKNFRKLMRAIKSPPNRGVTRFNEHDKFVAEAIENFERAIDFSERENTRAIYDLALLYKALGQFDKALNLLEEIYIRPDDSFTGPLDRIGAYEQSGLILMEQMNDANDTELKQKQAQDMLNLALSDSCKFYSRLPLVGVDIHRVWHSVASLLKLVDENDFSEPLEKMKNKVNILRMVKNPEKTLPLVRKLEQMADQKYDLEGLKLCVKSYVDMEKFESALPIIEALQVSQRPGVEYFQQGFIPTVFIRAGRQQLLKNTETALTAARRYFAEAFAETFKRSSGTSASGEPMTCSDTDTMSSDQEKESLDPWDVILLYDDGAEDAGKNLAEAFRKFCGLRVTCMDDDVQLGKFVPDGGLVNIMRSRVAVVLATGRKLSGELKAYLNKLATRRFVFAFTLHDDCHIPKALSSLRSQKRLGKFPAPLTTAATFNREVAANAITDIYFFMTGLSPENTNSSTLQ